LVLPKQQQEMPEISRPEQESEVRPLRCQCSALSHELSGVTSYSSYMGLELTHTMTSWPSWPNNSIDRAPQHHHRGQIQIPIQATIFQAFPANA